MQSGNVSDNAIEFPKLYKIGNEWSKITIDRMKKAFDKYKIKSRANLYNSFSSGVSQSSGIATIRISFLLYGKFVDMGVGRGVPRGAAGTSAFKSSRNNRGQLNQYRRRPKRFYSDTMGKETAILGGILVTEYSNSLNDLMRLMPERITIDI